MAHETALPAMDGLAPRDSTLTQKIHDRIKAQILALRLKPGVQLEEPAIAEMLAVSRTPVREALRLLERSGLVTIIPRKGAFVSILTIQDVAEIDQLREILEPMAARLAASRIDVGKLEEVERLLDSLEPDQPGHEEYLRFIEIDSALHDAILQASGNRQLLEIVQRLHNRLNPVRVLTTATRFRDAIEDARRVIEALKARDADRAESEMRQHVRGAFRAHFSAHWAASRGDSEESERPGC